MAADRLDPTPDAEASIPTLIARARRGNPDALGQLFQALRSHLLQAARQELPDRLRAKVAPSDIVQETAFEAHRDFAGFTGTTADECFAWLRAILRNNVVDAVRRFEQSQKRDTGREISMDAGLGRAIGQSLKLPGQPPDGSAIRREDATVIRQLLARLPRDYASVIEMRYWQGLSFPEIASRLGRSPEAVRKLWYRGLQQLNVALAARADGVDAPGDDSPLAFDEAVSSTS
jgi:RNA polymerase sigma-70 factor (ECF subfamily)